MKYYRYLFLGTALAYLGCYILTDRLVYLNESSNKLVPVSTLDAGFLNDNASLLMVAAAALFTFIVLSIRKFDKDGIVLVTVLSFLLQFGAFAWLEHGSVYATALGMGNSWLLAGLLLQSSILVVVIWVMTFK